MELYRLLAVAKYEDRYVIPAAHAEVAQELDDLACALDGEGGPGQFASPPPRAVSNESFHVLKAVRAERASGSLATSTAVDLPHWDGKGVALGMPKIRSSDD
ncbi:hypothetical protein GCM10025876_04580 [Demequina litorisediminis]|uniref:Uncharacterized protein n=1 Tax=Demequina litorisediminis TaxID=1849022 RepID=A0ABQ6I8X6_9MICO|nr:hypothetical protein GCM10025876_04580 [Demequina litorisediminis]